MANFSPLAVAALATSLAASFLILSPPQGAYAFVSPRTTGVLTHLISQSQSRATRGTSSALSAQDKYNPMKTLLGDMASSLFSSGGGSSSNPDLDSKVAGAVASSWDDIRSKLESKQTEQERMFRPNLAKGYGTASPLNLVRLYDESNKEEDIRVTLYRDHASWCPYCHKVWMTLEEKRIPYRVEKINMRCYGEKPPSFTRLQPSGAIPVAIIDGAVYNQSNDIIYALEQLFPDHKTLSPSKESDRTRAQGLLRLERKIFSEWMYWLTGGQRRDGFIAALEEVESELKSSKGGDFFMGKEVSLVDFMFAPFLERMCASLLYFKGYQIRVAKGQPTDFPAVNKWFDAMETLESYQLTKSDYYTHCWDLPPQLGGCVYEDDGERYEKAINGGRTLDGTQGSWELPLQKHNGGVEPDWEWCGDDSAACREATERLSYNHENIVKFAARGAGRKGMPPFSAPLSDPNAMPNDAVLASVDAVLRTVSLALLQGTDACEEEMTKVADALVEEGGKDFAGDIVNSLAYLRDRVGVPRDMKLPAARQLRAHLNWSIGKILDSVDK